MEGDCASRSPLSPPHREYFGVFREVLGTAEGFWGHPCGFWVLSFGMRRRTLLRAVPHPGGDKDTEAAAAPERSTRAVPRRKTRIIKENYFSHFPSPD